MSTDNVGDVRMLFRHGSDGASAAALAHAGLLVGRQRRTEPFRMAIAQAISHLIAALDLCGPRRIVDELSAAHTTRLGANVYRAAHADGTAVFPVGLAEGRPAILEIVPSVERHMPTRLGGPGNRILSELSLASALTNH